jgi:enterochelin esterase-like enzyme
MIVWIYLPPDYDANSDRRYPTLYQIQGLTGQLDMWRNRAAFRPPFPELVDELFASASAPPCLVVWVNAHDRTLAVPAHRGIAGKSSGGYGAGVT